MLNNLEAKNNSCVPWIPESEMPGDEKGSLLSRYNSSTPKTQAAKEKL